MMKLDRKEFLGVVARGAATTMAAAVVAADAHAAPGQSTAPASTKAEGVAIKGATEAVQHFITSSTLSKMPPAAIAMAKQCLVDGFGVMLAGSTLHGSAIVRDHIKSLTDKREATILGRERLAAPASHAALANGAAGHAMDFDDTQLSTTPDRTFGLLTHPTVPAVAAAVRRALSRRA